MLSNSWDLEETRQLVERQHGRPQLWLLNPCLDSLNERAVYSSYRFIEYKRLLRESIDSKLSKKDLFELTFRPEAKDQNELAVQLYRVRANIVACLQSLHCLADTLAHAIYYSSGLNLSPRTALRERDISNKKVIAALSPLPKFSTVQSILQQVADSAEFKYLSAIVNHSKHRSIIKPVVAVDFRTDAPYAIEFSAFTYAGEDYEMRDVKKVLEPTYSILSSKMAECGIALNAALRAEVP
jgi:hypothetical protein